MTDNAMPPLETLILSVHRTSLQALADRAWTSARLSHSGPSNVPQYLAGYRAGSPEPVTMAEIGAIYLGFEQAARDFVRPQA